MSRRVLTPREAGLLAVLLTLLVFGTLGGL